MTPRSSRKLNLTLTRPLRRKIRMRWFFDVSKVKESSFFKSDLTNHPAQIDAHLLENTNLNFPDFIFQWVLYRDHVLSQMVLKLIRTNEIIFCRINADTQFSAQRACEG